MARPVSKYTGDAPQRLVKHMEEGFSFESFAGVMGCSRACIYKWIDKYPEFKEAREIGSVKSQLMWEKAGIDGLYQGGKDNPFNATVWVFNMKNRFGWRDKQEMTGKDGESLKIVLSKEQEDLIMGDE